MFTPTIVKTNSTEWMLIASGNCSDSNIVQYNFITFLSTRACTGRCYVNLHMYVAPFLHNYLIENSFNCETVRPLQFGAATYEYVKQSDYTVHSKDNTLFSVY